MDKAKEAEIWPNDLVEKIENADYYATFDVGKYMDKRYGRGPGSGAYKQYDTHQLIANPATATLM